MKILIKYYGKLTDITHVPEEWVITEPHSTVEQLEQHLAKKYPGLQKEDYTLFKNKNRVEQKSENLAQNDIISLMPPFSGG